MMKKKKSNLNFNLCVVIGSIALFSVLYIVFMSLNFTDTIVRKLTGFDFLEYERFKYFDNGSISVLAILSLIIVCIIIVIALLRLINNKIFNSRVYMLIQIVFGVALAIISILMYIKVSDFVKPFAHKTAIGVILYLIMGILTSVSSVALFFVQEKKTSA